MLLEAALTEVLNLRADRVLIVDTGPTEGRGRRCIATLGRPVALPSDSALVV